MLVGPWTIAGSAEIRHRGYTGNHILEFLERGQSPFQISAHPFASSM